MESKKDETKKDVKGGDAIRKKGEGQKHTTRKIDFKVPRYPRPGTAGFPFTINNCVCRLLNGFKQLVIMIDVLGENVIYVRNYDDHLNAEQKGAFDGLVAWANGESGGTFPTAIPDPEPDPPIDDNMTISIFNGNKVILAYIPHEGDVHSYVYVFLSSEVQNHYDVLCAWADTIDDRFLSSLEHLVGKMTV
jgi:hypothetical protein